MCLSENMITTNAIPKECHMKMLPERDNHEPDRVLVRKAWNFKWIWLREEQPADGEEKGDSSLGS